MISFPLNFPPWILAVANIRPFSPMTLQAHIFRFTQSRELFQDRQSSFGLST